MRGKIYQLLQSREQTNRTLAWQLDKSQGFGIKKHLEKVFEPFLKKYTLDELFTMGDLYLDNLSLGSIPVEIGLLSQLKWLNLSYNNLTSIPKELGKLSQLKGLNLNNNNLTEIPKELGNLSQLEGLNLSDNNLTSIQKELGKLPQLRWLFLSDNNLTSIQKELGKLPQLRWLHLDGNPLPQKEVDKIRKMLPNCGVCF